VRNRGVAGVGLRGALNPTYNVLDAATFFLPMLINNRYQVISTLGEGGFGHAYLAEDVQMPSRRHCVLKQLKPVTTSAEVYQVVQARFQREAAILEKLGENHPQIPRLYAYFSENQQFYLVQEWIEGVSLEDIVADHGPQSEALVRSVLTALLPVLDFIHRQGIIHRDLKPDNIMLRADTQQPVLIDFGAVRETMGTVFNSRNHPTSSIVIGTPGYMAAEQAAGRPIPSSDLYSLGLTAIFLLTGKPPQSLGSDPASGEIIWRSLAQHLSPDFVEVIDRAVRSYPRDRYASAQQMLAALAALPPAPSASVPMPIASAPPASIPPPAASSFKTVAVSPAALPAEPGIDLGTETFAANPTARNATSSSPVATHLSSQPTSNKRLSPLVMGVMAAAVGGGAIGGGLLFSQMARDSTVSPTVSEPSPEVSERPNTANTGVNPSPQPTVSAVDQGSNVTPDAPDLPAESASAGTQITLNSSQGGQINLYDRPSFAASSPSYGLSGDRVTILKEAQGDDGDLWYFVRFASGAEGWVSSAYADPSSASNTNSADVSADDAIEDSSNESDDASEAAENNIPPTPPTLPQLTGLPGAQVNVYSAPSASADSPSYGLVGDRVVIVNSAQGDDGLTWYQVRFESGTVGWISPDSIVFP
jgi:serine/threonine protein kinase, bacterial